MNQQHNFGESPLKKLYQLWRFKEDFKPIVESWLLRTNLPYSAEEIMDKIIREEIFAPAIDIPPEITIRCFEFDQWWNCYLKSETLCYEKGIVPKGILICVDYLPIKGMREKAVLICTWLGDRGWVCEQLIPKVIPSISILEAN